MITMRCATIILPPALKVVVLLVVLILSLLFSAGCSRTRVTEDFFQSYLVRSGTVLEIYNPNGQVTVTGSDHDKVEIAALKETYHGQSALDEVDIFIDIGEIMIIETVHSVDGKDVTVSYDIKVPEGVEVSVVECSNGNIDVQGISGSPVLSTSNGNINVSAVGGVVSARSSNGDLDIKTVEGLGYLRTSNGDIIADLPDIREDLDIRTSNGLISLSINPELALNLEASTSNGEISFSNLDLETTLQEQTLLAGIMNGGGPKLNIATSNGSIDLAQLQQ